MNPNDPQGFADAIAAGWRASTEGVLDACRAAHDARQAGCLADVASLLGKTVHPTTLRRLAIIGARADILAHAAILPPAWGTLYELTKLDPVVFAGRVIDGSITPALERSTVTGWLKPGGTVAAPASAPTVAAAAVADMTLGGALKTLSKLRKDHKPSELAGECKPAELRMAIAFLQGIADAQQQRGVTP